ncbi:MAG: hypothetical protein PHV78_01400 [Patescibacteria group bacterium]|nr:hypothetical protein [Patescibacteria group bacterium]MDD5121189.1 hypothetical protein [Patescibacteria group bacterium]MDD5222001.1 hypothetical protein [Patescibacteria group bacterium]MDD5395892.1 hypothetical protein [Patescibacteria group bacterium]
MNNNEQSKECCPEFNVEKWDKKTISWNNKKFIKDTMPEFFHIPFPPTIAKKITRMWQAVEQAGASAANKEDTLILFRDPTPFKGEIYISVEKDVSAENNVVISGNFVSRIFDGGYNDIPKFLKVMNEYLAEMEKKAKDYYIHYAYCPKCAKKFGHNYMIIFAKV